jgi:hypothetical protein
VGQSRLARRLTTILSAMHLVDALETMRMHRVAGRTGARTAVVITRSCRAPTSARQTWLTRSCQLFCADVRIHVQSYTRACPAGTRGNGRPQTFG